MSGSFRSGDFGRESSAYGGSDRYGGGSQNRAGSGDRRDRPGRSGTPASKRSDDFFKSVMDDMSRSVGISTDPTTGRTSYDPRSGGGTGQGGAGGVTYIGQGSFGGLPGEPTRDEVQTQDQIGANVANALNDYNNVGNSPAENAGNGLAGLFGFNEIDPTAPGFSQPGMPGTTGQADWGFDPAGLIGGAALGAAGVPIVGGFIADQISAGLGRPLEVNLGPSVFGGEIVDPETGAVTASGGKTYNGSNVVVRDPGDHDTAVGVSPQANSFLGGLNAAAQPAAPASSTYTGANPAIAEPAAPAPTTPQLPDVTAPGPIDAGNVSVDTGNSGLTGTQLTDLFTQAMLPKTYKGRNRNTVVV